MRGCHLTSRPALSNYWRRTRNRRSPPLLWPQPPNIIEADNIKGQNCCFQQSINVFYPLSYSKLLPPFTHLNWKDPHTKLLVPDVFKATMLIQELWTMTTSASPFLSGTETGCVRVGGEGCAWLFRPKSKGGEQAGARLQTNASL